METSGATSTLRVRSSIISKLGFTTAVDDELEDSVSLDMSFKRSMNVMNFDLVMHQ